MKYGLFGINFGPCADPEVSSEVAIAAEAAGFESLWTGEHVALPSPQAPPSPVPAETPFVDPAVALAYIAGQTQSILLGTGIIILPQRNPVVLAKELASVDVVSKGRLLFGLGVGYIPAEFEALGVPYAQRGARSDEYLEAILALWTEPQPSFEGEFVRFSGIDAMPRPVQQPHPPVVVGGLSDAAFSRAVTRGNGWYGFALDAEATARCLEGIKAANEKDPRPTELGGLEISVTPRGKVDREAVARYEDLGVDRLIVQLRPRGEETPLEAVDRIATGVGLTAS